MGNEKKKMFSSPPIWLSWISITALLAVIVFHISNTWYWYSEASSLTETTPKVPRIARLSDRKQDVIQILNAWDKEMEQYLNQVYQAQYDSANSSVPDHLQSKLDGTINSMDTKETRNSQGYAKWIESNPKWIGEPDLNWVKLWHD